VTGIEPARRNRLLAAGRSAVDDCLHRLEREHRDALPHLTAEGIIPAPTPELLEAIRRGVCVFRPAWKNTAPSLPV